MGANVFMQNPDEHLGIYVNQFQGESENSQAIATQRWRFPTPQIGHRPTLGRNDDFWFRLGKLTYLEAQASISDPCLIGVELCPHVAGPPNPCLG